MCMALITLFIVPLNDLVLVRFLNKMFRAELVRLLDWLHLPWDEVRAAIMFTITGLNATFILIVNKKSIIYFGRTSLPFLT